ncbi:poly(U)-specific 3'-to-5' RNA exonuclease [Tyrophagus putrescentiae]|nr:poly(U)-specific 3'-to-5' RNA exonuclease [Tyrophagus putrescentiae]
MLPSKDEKRRKDEAESDAEENDTTSSTANKRQRTFASVRNQFVVHVFVPLEGDEQIEEMYDDFADITDKVVFEKEPHISLIRGHYAVEYHQIDPLLNQLEAAIKSYSAFSLCLSKLRQPQSQEMTNRLKVENENEYESLNSRHSPRHELIKSVHTVLKQYRSEVVKPVDDDLVNRFIYHTSIAWFLSADQEIGQRMVDQVAEHFAEQVILKRITKVHLSVGHRKRIVDLSG